MDFSRSLETAVKKDLDKKVVLLSGPRQVGKTTLSRALFKRTEYLNFDHSEGRKAIMGQTWVRDVDLVVFDELHKWPKWKNWIKGVYDVEGSRPRLLVTGSARLDVFKKGSDSLAGRHFQYRLHPLTVAELKDQVAPRETLERLMAVGGFPEPFRNGTEAFAMRWRSTHLDRVLKEDVLELEPIRRIKLMEILVDLLAERVGSPVSLASLARDLEVSPHTVKHWVSILEAMYVVFVVPPYSKKMARALLKEPKIYFYDCGKVRSSPGARFENVVACALLKDLHMREDLMGEKTRLHYVRDKEKREVDFLTLVDGGVEALVEDKLSDNALSPSLRYFTDRLKPKFSVQLVHGLNREQQHEKVKVVRAENWLCTLERATE